MGAVEVANRLVEGQIRTIKGRPEQLLKITISITDPIVLWVVRHASPLLNRYSVKFDGYSTYGASKGRPCGGDVVELGEQVYWKCARLDATEVRRLLASWVVGQSGEVGP